MRRSSARAFHQKCEPRELRGAIVDVEAVEVLLQYEARNISQTVAALQINLLEDFVGLHKDMTRTGGGGRSELALPDQGISE